MCKVELSENAYEFGIKAFENGLKRVPARDEDFLDACIKGLDVGEGAVDLMKLWLKGWDDSKLKVSVILNDDILILNDDRNVSDMIFTLKGFEKVVADSAGDDDLEMFATGDDYFTDKLYEIENQLSEKLQKVIEIKELDNYCFKVKINNK